MSVARGKINNVSALFWINTLVRNIVSRASPGSKERRALAKRRARLLVGFGVDVHHSAAGGVHHLLESGIPLERGFGAASDAALPRHAVDGGGVGEVRFENLTKEVCFLRFRRMALLKGPSTERQSPRFRGFSALKQVGEAHH